MITFKLYTALAHVTSQLLERWIPAPSQRYAESTDARISRPHVAFDSSGYAGLDAMAWLELLEQDVSSFFPWLPWLPKLMRQKKISIRNIAEAAELHFSAIMKNGASYISIHDWNYPKLLKYIARPPLGLTLLGNQDVISQPSIAVIGSRRASYEALKTTVDVGLECARSEIGIVSGGAVGCDIAAHEGMLVSGMTNIQAIVVQAGGLVGLFPKSNLGTFSEILLRGGAIISERLWFQAVRPHDFPSRNRIVSGMCEATVVMAAALKSGSLITASEALEQGRDVYVFASGHDDVRFEGSTQLIHDGATPFLSAAELLAVLSLNYGDLSLAVPSQRADYCQEVLNVGTFNGETH
ncbi:MAG: DNA-processing protein DprA [bacterium]